MALKQQNTNRLTATINWWEKKRIWFNLSYILISLYVFLRHNEEFYFDLQHHISEGLIWMLFANLIYSTGILVEVFNIYYFKSRLEFFKLRILFFGAGTILFGGVTYLHCILYYIGFW